MNEDLEITLRANEWEAIVAPLGAGLRALKHAGAPIAMGYCGKENKQGSQGDVLIPFPGRVGCARYIWEGVQYTLPQNDKDGPNAIHGFLRTANFTVAEQNASSVVFSLSFPGAEGYPFPLLVEIAYHLNASGLSCTFHLTNPGPVSAPVAAGFHPYFHVGSDHVDLDSLTLPFESMLEMEHFIPTGKLLSVAEAGLDFRSPSVIGSRVLNHCFLKPNRDSDGLCRVVLRSASGSVTVWMDSSFDYVVLYTGENLPPSLRRTSLAIEPMTCGSDALNHPEWGLVTLVPGAVFSGTWGVTAA